MTDARQGTAGCPDFESLSCYTDGELDLAAAAGVAAHVGECGRCAALAVQLREGFEADGARRDGRKKRGRVRGKRINEKRR